MSHSNFADQLTPDQIQKIFDELGIRWRDKPRNGDWVNNVENPNIAGALSVNIRNGAFVPHEDKQRIKHWDEDLDYKAQGDIVKLVRLAKGLENRTEAIKWINKMLGIGRRSKVHVFHIEDAERYGIKGAVILQNIRTWLDTNKAKGRNIREGRVWTYNKRKAFTNYHPYLTEHQIRYQLEKLEEAGILVSKRLDKHNWDQVLYYSINEPEYLLEANETTCENSQIVLSKTANES